MAAKLLEEFTHRVGVGELERGKICQIIYSIKFVIARDVQYVTRRPSSMAKALIDCKRRAVCYEGPNSKALVDAFKSRELRVAANEACLMPVFRDFT